ncbi:MAG TPA: hypothetical protein VJ725_05905 [Thermoanaerobaculia bacterium]|nr:hypothetical protein [Thermoanaerobaculia bacterium]
MEDAILLYDAKCPLCRNLALKIRFHARRPVEIMALSDPEASAILNRFYPKGWEHDFYLIHKSSCRKGILALPKLMRVMGLRQFGSLLGEFVSYSTARAKCSDGSPAAAAPAGADKNLMHSRRQLVTMAAAVPLLAPFAKLPRLSDPFERSSPEGLSDISANLAVVWRDTTGSFHAEVRPIGSAVRKTGGFKKQTGTNAKITHREQVILEESPGTESKRTAGGLDSVPFVLRRTILEGEANKNGVVESRFLDSYGLGLDYGRFNISLNAGAAGPRGGALGPASLSGMVRHDFAIPLIDYIVFAGDEQADVATHFSAYLEGVRALRRYHSAAKQGRIANLYTEIEAGFEKALEIFTRNVSEQIVPVKSKIVITSMPELMKFVDLGPELAQASLRIAELNTFAPVLKSEGTEADCDCTCSCDICCGCGCGCGGGTCGIDCSCGCGCCAACECGCSCCLSLAE